MSDPHASGDASNPVLAKNHTVDAVVAVILLLIGIVVIVEARRLGAGWTTDGPGAGYFPFYVGLVLCISALGIFYQSMVGPSKDTRAFVDREQLQRVLAVFAPAMVYVLAITFLGLYVASAIYIALFMIILGKYSPLKSIALAVIVNVVFFMMFEVWFKVPLFKGKIEPLAFLGY